jgi:hypothetical protein
MTGHAELIERALAAVEADRLDLARGHDGRSCLRQSEGAALAAALAAETERADKAQEGWDVFVARMIGAETGARLADARMRAAEAREAALREALEQIAAETRPATRAPRLRVIAREALARTAGGQP